MLTSSEVFVLDLEKLTRILFKDEDEDDDDDDECASGAAMMGTVDADRLGVEVGVTEL